MLKFIFLVGRTLIDEQNFYSFIDSRLLYLLNQFGAKIDNRNYDAIKNDIIKNRKLLKDGVVELAIQICKVLLPKGYEKIILKYILPSIEFAEKHLLYPSEDAITTLEFLSKNYKIGVIGSHENKISKILKTHEMNKYFNCCILSYEENREPVKEIFSLIRNMLDKTSGETLLIGDRLDTHIHTANTLGIFTIRLTNSIFKVQEPTNQYEIPKFTLNKLGELAKPGFIMNKFNPQVDLTTTL
jgi:putative hydrolase of the HAD superfamily